MDRPMMMAHRLTWVGCHSCELGTRCRHWCLYGYHNGNRDSTVDVMFLGEGPGEVENLRGEPFVGPSGQFLRRAVDETGMAEGLTILYSNLVACRPQDSRFGPNRQPTLEEIRACKPRLINLLHTTRPRVVVGLGRVAEWSLGATIELAGLTPTFIPLPHPAALKRRGSEEAKDYPEYLKGLKLALGCAMASRMLEREKETAHVR